MMLLTSRRWFRVAVVIAAFVVVVDLLLTVRVYTPGAKLAPLHVSSPLDREIASHASLNFGSGGGNTTAEAGSSGGNGEGGKGGKKVKEREKEKLYIASIHWNDAEILSSHWIPALLDLVREYGKENLFISILESGSWDEAKDLLRSLDSLLGALGVERSIVLEDGTREDDIAKGPGDGEEGKKGWVWGTRGKMEMRRVPYLAAARNRAMMPLKELGMREGEGRRVFEKVVWLNDVIFTVRPLYTTSPKCPQDLHGLQADQVTTLLATRNGSYAATCALDFSVANKLYDSFAVRDSLGLPALTLLWPYFASPTSRSAILNYAPTPVRSCWNGLVIFDSAPFYSGLEFRGIDDSLAQKHVEASECCLIHSDNVLSGEEGKGVWINPNVRVAYNPEANGKVNGEGEWPTSYGKVGGVWANRWHLTTGWYLRWKEKWVVDRAVKRWADEEGGREEGKWCLADSMQVLVDNGWAHI